MKRIYFILILICLPLVFISCQKEKKWEYKTIYIPVSSSNYGDSFPFPNEDVEALLNNEGKNGWELVSAVAIDGTTFPNFGDNRYVTGIRDLVATRSIQYILKRSYIQNRKTDRIDTDSCSVTDTCVIDTI